MHCFGGTATMTQSYYVFYQVKLEKVWHYMK